MFALLSPPYRIPVSFRWLAVLALAFVFASPSALAHGGATAELGEMGASPAVALDSTSTGGTPECHHLHRLMETEAPVSRVEIHHSRCRILVPFVMDIGAILVSDVLHGPLVGEVPVYLETLRIRI